MERSESERKRAEKTLHEVERLQRLFFEHLSDVIYTSDCDFRVTSVSASVERHLGYRPEELVGRQLNDINVIAPESLEVMLKDALQTLAGGTVHTAEYVFIRKDGSRVIGEVSRSPLVEDGKIVGLISVARDITERKRAEAALLAAEELYRTLAESSQVSVYIVQDRKIVFANSHFSNYSGYEKENIMGRDVSSFVYPEDREMVRQKAIQLLKGESAIPYEYRIIDKSGRLLWLMETVSPITYQGRPATLGNTMDITELKRMEKELEDVRRTLIQSEKLAALGQLASGAAHEIRNPLNIMSLRLQMLDVTGKAVDDDVRKVIDTCNTQINRITRVLDGLYEFSRMPQTEKTQNDLNKIIEEVVVYQDKRFKDEGITPEIRYGEDIPSFMFDKEKISMVITHLISNAVDAMRGQEARHLRISTEKIPAGDKAGENVRIIISDSGHGIKELDKTRIFDPFFTTKGPDKGKGLGLAVSYGIIRDHGGTIRAENIDEGGARFFIDLPVGGSATA